MLGHLIYNYNQLDDARIQQEISRKLYAPIFGGTYIVHAYDGKSSFGYKPYLEDAFIRLANAGHYQGAVNLINAGMRHFFRNKRADMRYVLVTAADTWCLNAQWLHGIVQEMQTKGQWVATSSWGSAKLPEKPTGFASDFFIIDLEWNRRAKIWPLPYAQLKHKFLDLQAFLYSMPSVERAFQYAYFRYILSHHTDNDAWHQREFRLRRIAEREPIHTGPLARRRQSWPGIGLYTDPFPAEKRRALRKLKVELGPNAQKLKQAKSLAYYNAAFWKDGKHSDPKEPIPVVHRRHH